MAYWLVKSEPEDWSFEDQLRVAAEPWDGVRSAQAQNNMKKMALGDGVFFYHSGSAREIVGLCDVVKAQYPDPSDNSGKYCLVDLHATHKALKPVTLKDIKADGRFNELALVRQPRLSVMPIDQASYEALFALANMRAL